MTPQAQSAQPLSSMPPRHRFFSPGRIGAIAGNTLLELVRQKVFYFLLIFALALIGCSFFMGFLRPELQFQVMKDVSLGAMSVFTWLLAVLATAMMLPKDIEDRTLYTILAKPVPRLEYLLGKLLGVLFMLAISLGVMAVLFAATLYIKEQTTIAAALGELRQAPPEQVAEVVRNVKAATFTWSLVPGIAIIYFKAALFASLTLLISTFASSWIFTIVISVAVYLIGHLVPIARTYLLETDGSWISKAFLTLLTLMFPDLQLFNLTDDIVAGNALPPGLFFQTAGMGCFYLAIYTCLAYLMFSKKEL
ncbi:MAG: ABC transporter permease subunit [Chthoniobacteraceae bacterium]|nr:ABC transporter permease subunit [Chthoniobacteraceae bacterium]